MTTISSGQYRYEVVENWCKPPTGWTFGLTSGVAVDSQERIFVCQQEQDPPILVFDPQGNYISSWGTGSIINPHTIYIPSDDILYLTDRVTHMASKWTLDGTPLLEMGNRMHPSDTGCTEDEGEVLWAGGPFNRPTRMTPSPSGDLYISDGYRNCRVHRFSADGSLISSWGTPGKTAPGEIRSPHSVWVDRQGVVYVCDRLNNRVQVFSATGEFISQWTNVELATDIYMDANETVYVCERNTNPDYWITVRDKSGNVQARFDTPAAHQIRVDAHGDIYVAVPGDGKISKCVKQR